MTTMLIEGKQRGPVLPADLRERVGESALIEFALEAVQAVGAKLPRPLGWEGRHSPQMLLTLLTYCYAAGSYGSEDIEYDCRNDAATRYLCANAAPDQETIRSFRRAHREWIESCLVSLYSRACSMKQAEAGAEPMAAAAVQAEQKSDVARFARRKLELAILFDTAMSE